MQTIAVSNTIGRSCEPREMARAKTERKANDKAADPHLVNLGLKVARFRPVLGLETKNENFALALVTIGQWMEALNAMLTGCVERCGTVCTFQTRLEKIHGAAHQVEKRTVRSV